ncbi:BppU family phage baseplate upper protein [Bacillus cereus group sp. MYBK79-1]|uniref:BppU family phage baseplate upper protein n=1 Tax=unclassified Bacillus cereus group TaxID=2750818 RepID=UPI003F796BE7
MTFKTYEINVDLVNDISTTSAIRFSQNDRNSAKLLLTITNKGEEIDLSKAKSVRMSFKKPDGTRVFQNDCQPINPLKGKYQILLKTQTLTSIGNVIAQIHIEEEDRILDTQKFLFVVNESLAGDGAVESTNDFTIIKKALELGEKFKDVDFDPIIKAGELAQGALPKTGGTLRGTVVMETGDFEFKNPMSDVLFRNNQSGIFAFYDKAQDQVIWTYNSKTKEFIVGSTTNLLKKTGDTMTGNLLLQSPNTEATRKISFINESGNEAYNWSYQGGRLAMRDVLGSQDIWIYSAQTKTFNLMVPNTNIVTKTKDGRATLTLTENATQYGSTYTPVATRRGNTVTLRMVISRNGNDNGVITTLPADMRPVDGVTSTIVASDGTSSDVVIRLNGEVEILTKNKTYRILLTYVVD